MPRVRLRTPESLTGPSLFHRFARFITGGETWTYHHLQVFVLTFFSFALIHATRKTLSTVKTSMISVWTHGTETE
ncbi:hypothetical protein OESDEN_17708 [Oesophagostomum dentatum]|uniref:Uncharacterized protein n=1 Tax=Oesophagostomum dentatum TaxID=61180 RepID=A0A0B1SBC5_OESDE|nr:hypothetical protein OESDEN_17708 [Oesophagostomum dentatum]